MNTQIYFIAAPSVGRFKIGKTGGFDTRFSALQSSSPVRLAPVFVGEGPPELEEICQTIASNLGYKRVHGEWFEGKVLPQKCVEILECANLIHMEDVAKAHVALEAEKAARHRRTARERARRKRIDANKAYFAARRA